MVAASDKGKYFIYVIFSVASLGGLSFGYHFGVISGAMIQIKKEIEINDTWHQLIVAIVVAAWAIFALISGPLADRFGRKTGIMFSCVLFVAGSLVMACARTIAMLLIGRFLIGGGMGTAITITPMYIAESTPPNMKGRLSAAFISIANGGIFVSSIIAGAMSYVPNGWRYMIGLACIPPVIQVVGFIFLPESPYWLANHNSKQLSDQNKDSEAKKLCQKIPLLTILTTPSTRRALIVGCCLQLVQQACGFGAVIFYSASIMQMAGFENENVAIWLGCVITAINFVANCFGVYLVERVGRRPLTLVSLLGVGLSCMVLGIGFHILKTTSMPVTQIIGSDLCSLKKTCEECVSVNNCGFFFFPNSNASFANSTCTRVYLNETVNSRLNGNNFMGNDNNGIKMTLNYCPSPHSWILVCGAILFFLTFAPGMGSTPWTINAEIYPQWARATGNALSSCVNSSITVLVTVTFLSLVSLIGKDGAFFLYACISLVGCIILFFSLPETKGTTLENVEERFRFSFFKNGLKSPIRKRSGTL